MIIKVPSPEATDALIALLDVRNNFAFLPHRRVIDAGLPDQVITPLLTLCNCYAVCFCAARGLRLPVMKANEQERWLREDSDARLAGWSLVDRYTAIKRTNLGYTVVIVARNELGHGHIGMGSPNLAEPQHLFVTAAGAVNVTKARIEASFGELAPKALCYINTNEGV